MPTHDQAAEAWRTRKKINDRPTRRSAQRRPDSEHRDRDHPHPLGAEVLDSHPARGSPSPAQQIAGRHPLNRAQRRVQVA